jgi:hypothetical protein
VTEKLPLADAAMAPEQRSAAARAFETRDALATIVGYVLLIAVLSIAVAALALTMEKGVVDLTRRVNELLALRP